jgi:predicted protein tyrosine phosphatase
MKKTPPSSDIAVISIVEPEDDFLVSEGFLDVLRLEFHDATDKDEAVFSRVKGKIVVEKVNIKLFNEEMAKEIVAFLTRNSDNNIMIHCRAGMSRSAAVTRFAADLLCREPIGWATNTTLLANAYVLAILNRERWK